MSTRFGKVRQGFTLVELLVVIAIIMVLTGLVATGLSRAQKQAQTMHCMNNMRMLGEAIINYANTQGGFLPNFGFVQDWELYTGNSAPQGMKRTDQTPADMDIRVADQWVWELDFISEADRYLSRQNGFNSDVTDSILPPRMAPPVLQCPADAHLFINGQSILTSYWMHPRNSLDYYPNITNRSVHVLGMEADALNEVGSGTCGCRFHLTEHPLELDTTHFGGGHILFADGSVRLFTTKNERLVATWEALAWPATY